MRARFQQQHLDTCLCLCELENNLKFQVYHFVVVTTLVIYIGL